MWRPRNTFRHVTGAFGIGDEADEQHTAIGTIWWLLAEFITP
jgi:hypothetical protein